MTNVQFPIRVLAIRADGEKKPIPSVQHHFKVLETMGVQYDMMHLHPQWLKYPRAALRVFNRSLQGKYDLIHAIYGMCGLAARFQVTLPLITTFLGSDLQGGRVSEQYKFDGFIGGIAARLTDHLIVMSEEMKQLSGRSDALVIPWGVNTDIFRPVPKAEARQKLGFRPEERLVLFAWDPTRIQKRFDVVQAAMAHVQRQAPDVKLIVCFGKPHEEVALYMNACDVLVMTSDHEGSPVAIREALACNLPIVANDVGDTKDWIAQVEHCHIVPFDPQAVAEKLLTVLNTGARTTSAETMQELDARWASERILQVYLDALGQPPLPMSAAPMRQGK